ncbi:MAG: helix-turn-helix domain-containing protein [Alistipes sp.]
MLHILGSVLFKHSNLLYSDNPVVEKINRAKAIMRTDFGRNRSPEQIAREVGMGYTWFRRVFREYVGMAPAQYQHTMRLNKARELLATTAHSISEIAYALGFESVSAFSLFFRLRERLSPSQYRARFRGEKGQ